MKRNANRMVVGAVALTLALPAVAQQAYPAPTTTAPTPATIAQTQSAAAATQPAPNSAASQQATDRPANPKQKICEATVIRAGPNQGQVINRCRRSDK